MIEENKEKSIIQIIQEMVAENESEEKIINTLKTQGISIEQAKRLLLIAQADTFTILNSEIKKISEKIILEQQQKFQKEVQEHIQKIVREESENLKKETEKSFLEQKIIFNESQKKFQKDILNSISKLAQLNEEVSLSSKENKKTIELINRDLNETKLKGVQIKRSLTRNILLSFGVLCFIIALIIIIIGFVGDLNLDHLTGGVILSFMGTVISYFSLNI